MTTYFAPIARLIGDLVVSFPPLQSLIEQGDDVCLVVRSAAQEQLASRIPGLTRVLREPDFLKQAIDGRFYNLREHPLQTDYVWGSPEFYRKYPGFGIDDVVRVICKDFGIPDGQDELKPLHAIPRTECLNKIVLVPGTAGPLKRWPDQHWIELVRKLAEFGKKAVMIGEPSRDEQIRDLINAGINWVPTPLLAEALDAVNSAAGVVAVDTGLMHLAVHQGVRTVSVFREYTMFQRPYLHVKYIVAPSCNPACREKEFKFSPNASTCFTDWEKDSSLDHWKSLGCELGRDKSCMSMISPDKVIEEMAANEMI